MDLIVSVPDRSLLIFLLCRSVCDYDIPKSDKAVPFTTVNRRVFEFSVLLQIQNRIRYRNIMFIKDWIYHFINNMRLGDFNVRVMF